MQEEEEENSILVGDDAPVCLHLLHPHPLGVLLLILPVPSLASSFPFYPPTETRSRLIGPYFVFVASCI